MSKIEEQLGFLNNFLHVNTFDDEDILHGTHRILLMIKSKDLVVKFLSKDVLQKLITLGYIYCDEYGLHLDVIGTKFLESRS
ncbi:hypothetical protein Phi18:2_gp22 [Cellulophaga phage phi18:2]|uniref:Uncharacterized protein n=2 Tax=Cellulophaga phage phi18:1 TaxID=1327982 RepID=S0A2Y5_9CAUD|nr:hypothetical protein Phi18:1_gp22 [Cellulophaga phage phi18:1]AGO48469.1 hypothetical protein Phi18:1_gp22 [Cellulophaga phage phi18:1]AGO49185.1 hypothetical protein Phi18:2_gp22 [Cellulophaga phage phi18:2]